MENQTAVTVSQAFTNNFITKFGCPRVVVSVNGKQFISNIFKDITKLYGFKHNKTTIYHPQSNGMAERLNRVIGDMLASYVNQKIIGLIFYKALFLHIIQVFKQV